MTERGECEVPRWYPAGSSRLPSAEGLEQTGLVGDLSGYLKHDIAFHQLVLAPVGIAVSPERSPQGMTGVRGALLCGRPP